VPGPFPNMLVMTGGRERTETDFRRLFEAAGLTLMRIVPTLAPCQGDRAMKAMFANLTTADFGGLSKQGRRAAGLSRKERPEAERKRVYALFEEIQIAIHHGEHARVEHLMAELAIATGKR
jgi:hypothetical protein